MATGNNAILRQLEQEWKAALASLPQAELARPGWLWAMEDKSPRRPAALFAELEDVRREWQELREWPKLREHGESHVNPGWTYKDLLAHLASWAEEFYHEVAAVAGGEAFDYEIPFEPKVGPTEWNAREVARRRAMSLDEIFDQYDDASARLQRMVIELAPQRLLSEARFPIRMGADPLVESIARIAGIKCWHDRYHFAQIRERLGKA
ncbi:MAG: DinB family protein [Candidatus Acidiferrales bacterium]